jgi:hypothetical protein
MHILRVSLLVSLMVLLAACGNSAAPANSGERSDRSSGAAESEAGSSSGNSQPGGTKTAITEDGAESPAVVLIRSGGMEGKTQTLMVLNDGLLRLVEGDVGGLMLKEGRARPEQMSRLHAAVQSEDWKQLQPMYGRQVPDGFSYTLVTGSKTIMTYDGAQMPALLEDVLSQLNDLWQQTLQS